MIFLSAQPDSFYFTWQIELQIFNFVNLGVEAKNIHVLIGFNPIIGLEPHFEELINKLQGKASFYLYPDNRVSPKYASSIRPHIIKQHFDKYPKLENDIIFYHDSDIIFRELPNFSEMISNNTCYVSNTISYLDTNYIKGIGGVKLLMDMCDIVGVSSKMVIAQDPHCGGAQYLLKNIPTIFWKKLESDSENLYEFMNMFNAESLNYTSSKLKPKKIQSWCADMWALLWNALYFKKRVEIHKELDFCWADSPIIKWHENKILHYTGSVQKGNQKIFRKLNYTEFQPYFDLDLTQIDSNNCSSQLVSLIKDYVAHQESSKIDLSNVLLIILFDSDNCNTLDTLVTQLRYLEKYFTVTIQIIERGVIPLYKDIPGLKKYKHTFLDSRMLFSFSNTIEGLKFGDFDIVAFTYANIFLDTAQFSEAINIVKLGLADIVIPNNNLLFKVDRFFQSIFDKCIDPLLLSLNKGKFNVFEVKDTHCMICRKETFFDNIFKGENSNIDYFSCLRNKKDICITNLDYPLFCFSTAKIS